MSAVARGIVPPRPLLSQRAEDMLRPRQKEILDRLEAMFLERGFATFTVGELAAELECSRRTLYELAPSKEDLVLTVLDRFLHRVGRTALAAIDESAPIPARIRAYFHGGAEILRQTITFAEDVSEEPSAARLIDRHFRYVIAVVEDMVRQGVESGEFRPVNPAVVSAALTGATLYLSQPDVRFGLGSDEFEASDEVLDLVLPALSTLPGP